MSSKSKPWVVRTENLAQCQKCGAASRWVDGVRQGRRMLTYWRWWAAFKQAHKAHGRVW